MKKAKILAVILAVLAVTGFFVVRNLTYEATEGEVVWQKDLSGADSAHPFLGYEAFSGGVIMYSRDGAEFTDTKGDSVWQRSYQMTEPLCSVCGSYAVIYDRGGTKLYIFSETGVTGDVTAAMAVEKAVVSGKGIVYAVLDDKDSEFITAYRKDGTPIDLSVKSVVNGDGYPFDIAVSPDGSQLITSYVSVSDGKLKESVVFRNFGEVGQNADSRRVVGGFIEEFEGHIVTKVTFPTNEYAHAFYDGGVVFFSTKVLNSPEIIHKVEMEGVMLSVAENSTHTCVVTEEEDGTRKLTVFDASGKETGSGAVDLSYTGIVMGEKNILIYNHRNVSGYSFAGRKILSLTGEGKFSAVIGASGKRELYTAEGAVLSKRKIR